MVWECYEKGDDGGYTCCCGAVQFIQEFTDCQSTWRLVWMSDLIFHMDFCGGLTL